MAEEMRDEGPDSAADEDRFLAISVSSLRLDTVTGFDLYLRVREGDAAVLYAKRDVKFAEEARVRLVENKVERLYIDVSDEASYRRYLEANLSALLADETVGAAQKSEMLCASAQGVVREMLNNPQTEEGVERSKSIVRNTVRFLTKDDTALRHLIESTSYNFDIYTHSVNACVFSVALAQRVLTEDPKSLRELGQGALLRDLGMGQLDDAISRSPRELSLEQFNTLKRHPLEGERLLMDLGGLGGVALDIVRHHHEKLNGKGYPDGLKGDQISPIVRVVTITDVFDALTTNRPDREALSTFEALKLMGGKMGAELDMNLLRKFIEMMGTAA